MGKRYAYTLDFSNGAGQTEAGKMIISGKDVKVITNVTDWDAKAVDLPEVVISGTATGVFSYKVGGTINKVTPDASGNWNIPVTNFDGVTKMNDMFYNCRSLTTLDLSHFDTSNVTNMAWMFSNCNSLTTMDLSHFDTSNVTNMYCMFWDCTSLTTLDLSHFDMSNVTNMKYMFSNCTNLKTITMKGCSQETINKIKTQLSEDGVTGCQIITE